MVEAGLPLETDGPGGDICFNTSYSTTTIILPILLLLLFRYYNYYYYYLYRLYLVEREDCLETLLLLLPLLEDGVFRMDCFLTTSMTERGRESWRGGGQGEGWRGGARGSADLEGDYVLS